GGNHHDSERDASGERGEMFLIQDNDGVGHDADDNGGNAVEHVGGESNNAAHAIAAELSQVDARTHSQRHAQNAGDSEDEPGTHDGIGHAAAGFAYRLRSLSQESPVDGADSAIHQIAED